MARHRVKYVLAAKLVSDFAEAADNASCPRPSPHTFGRVDLLCLDELGYMELDRRGAELLFQVLTEREETNSGGDRIHREFQRLDQDVHRPAALRRHR